MAFEDTLKETWFIATVAGIGALIIILVVIIIILFCLWFRKKKREDQKEKEGQHLDDIERDSSTPSSYQEQAETQNWMMVQQNGIASAPASDNTPRLIKGDDPYIAGSSLIKMNEEMRKNGGPPSKTHIETHKQSYYKSSIEKTLEGNQNVDAFERKISSSSDASRGGYGYRGAAVTSSGRFERANEVRESARSNQSFQKPRLANIHVSQSTRQPERSDSSRSTHITGYKQTSASQPYRIPEEDYSGIEMYSEEERSSWRTSAPTQATSSQAHASLHRLSDGKVRNLKERYETTEVSTADTAAASRPRSLIESEMMEQLAGRRAVPGSPRRTSLEVIQQDYSNPSVNWQGKSGKGTIETRVNRIKKVGAVSVFPD